MHIPDGFPAPPVWGALGVVSAPAVVVATRRFVFAAQFARRTVFFERGRIIADGPIDQVVQEFRWP